MYSNINVADISIAQDARSQSFHSKTVQGSFDTALQKFIVALRLPDESMMLCEVDSLRNDDVIPVSQANVSDSGSRTTSGSFAIHLKINKEKILEEEKKRGEMQRCMVREFFMTYFSYVSGDNAALKWKK